MRDASRWAAMLLVYVVTISAQAQQAASTNALVHGDEALATPGIMRVVLAFALVAGLAIGIVALLRRVLPRLQPNSVSTGVIRIVDRVSLSPGLRVYTLQAGSRTIVLAEGRSGLALTVVESPNEAVSQKESA